MKRMNEKILEWIPMERRKRGRTETILIDKLRMPCPKVILQSMVGKRVTNNHKTYIILYIFLKIFCHKRV